MAGYTSVGHGRGDPTQTSNIYKALEKSVKRTPPVSHNDLADAARVQKRLNETARQEYETKSDTLFRILEGYHHTLTDAYLDDIIKKSIEIDKIKKKIGQLEKRLETSTIKEKPTIIRAINIQITALKNIYDYSVGDTGRELFRLIIEEETSAREAPSTNTRKGGARRTRKHRGRKMRKTRHTRR